ncbi:uncharacterized protein ATNIH1004_007644 [Aspergillus tanneri]|uniref:Uncharacterized protein n=1 Tax=Aspergillus tanneri TaxID=1220188 RepID=A0A5M9MUP4_9EURO|nr:uncharacterized protein ATNIH1004_007644 [Aspergillus tanneri]KAA8646217.1 hypothetical protein ATNIH1004_007644 [Aspergillus tanneri]
MDTTPVEQNGILRSPPVSLPLVLQDPATSNLDATTRFYLDYYNERICRLFIVYDSDRNPFRSLISLALDDPVLLKATLALAARHRANTGRSFYQSDVATSPVTTKSHRDALIFKYQAVQGLSRIVNDVTLHRKDTTLAAVFLLIFLDLLESGSDKWNFHLEGAKNLITLDQRPPGSHTGVNQGAGRTVQEIRDFITRQIYLVETLGGTFVRPGLLSQFTTLDQFGRQLPEVVEQSFVGCPEFLLNAVQYILRQRDAIAGLEPLTKTTVHNRVQEITAVLESIQKFDCYLWASSLPQPQSLKRDLKNLCTLSETWKISALIYGQRVLDIHTNDVSPQDNLVCQLIELIGALKDDELYKCILWPIFIAGLECRWQTQRDFLVGCLEKFWTATQCYNTINAAKILQAYWQQESQQEPFSPQWIFDIGHLGRDWLLI